MSVSAACCVLAVTMNCSVSHIKHSWGKTETVTTCQGNNNVKASTMEHGYCKAMHFTSLTVSLIINKANGPTLRIEVLAVFFAL